MRTILIIGDYNPFTTTLIEKFNKEKWRINFFTRREDSAKPDTVFEQYIFEYTSDSVKNIINSARPDVIIFAGAFDTTFMWENANSREVSNNYIAGLNNILTYVGELGVRSFIYISSESVYEQEYLLDITEEFMPHPKQIRNLTLLRGENMVRDMNIITNTMTTVIRVAGMYGIPQGKIMCDNLILKLCFEALNTRRLQVNMKKKISVISVKDVVEALYIMIIKNERKYDLYHLSSMEEVSEDELGRLIRRSSNYSVDIIDKTIGIEQRMLLSNKRFQKEFPFEIRNDYKVMIPKIMDYIDKNRNLFTTDNIAIKNSSKRYTYLRWIKALIPFIEAIIVFTIIHYLSINLQYIEYLSSINLYLLFVLVFSLIYGRHQAIFTSFLCVIGMIINANLLDSNLYIKIVQVILVALPVGHLKDKFYEMKVDKERTIDFLKEQLRDLLKINSKNTYIKDYYAEKIISSKESIGRIYNITTKLQDAKMGEVQFAVLETILNFMETKDAAIYYVSNEKYCRLASASSDKASSLGKTIEINKYSIIFDEVKAGNVFINKSFDTRLPMMVNGIFSENNDMRIVIFVWTLSYEKMTLDSANLLRIISALFYSYFVRELNYIEALSFQRYIKDTKVLQEDAFHEMLDLYNRAKEKGYSQSSIIIVRGKSGDFINDSNYLYTLLRATDYMGKTHNNNFKVLLANTNENEVVYVKKRLEQEGFMIIR